MHSEDLQPVFWAEADSSTPPPSQGIFDLVCDTLREMNIEHCYRAVNGIIAMIPIVLRPWECSIIRDLRTNDAMRVDLYYGVVSVAERHLPFCKGNARFLRLFMRYIYTSKQSLIGLASIAGVEILWTYENLTGDPDRMSVEALAAIDPLQALQLPRA